jgi:hypothetical protein
VHHVGGVEEDLLDGLALLTDEARDPEAAVADLAASLAGPLEVAAAAAPASPEVLVHLAIGPNVERAVRRGAGACARRAGESGAVKATTTDGDDRRNHREPEEEPEHAARPGRYPTRATATRVWTSIAIVRNPPAAKAIVRCGCKLAM